MQFIDTHAHTYDEAFQGDLDATISSAQEARIGKILMPNIDVESIEPMFAIQEKYPNCIPMMGLHPAYVKGDWEKQLEKIESYLFADPERFCAIGEIGMDLYWDKTYIEEQKIAFIQQIQWAKKLDLPIAIHARDAFNEIFEILDKENDTRQAIAKRYLAEIKNEKIILPTWDLSGNHVFHLFVVRTSERDRLQSYLKQNNIEIERILIL